MKKFILSIAIFFYFNGQLFSHVDHYAKYNYLEYELFRNNTSIGYHKFDFKRDGNNLSIDSEVSFKISKLGVDLYKYFAESVENYEKNVFKSFSSTTVQNKKTHSLSKPHHVVGHGKLSCRVYGGKGGIMYITSGYL